MKKIKKYQIIIISIFILVFTVVLIKITENKDEVIVNTCGFSLDKKRIAVCPTFYKHLENIDQDVFDIYFTNSSSESFYLLENNQVDLVLSGRTLKPGERSFLNKVLGDYNNHYSFLSATEKTIYSDQLSFYNFYTDLDKEKIKQELGLENIEKVDNIYEFLNKGIVITSWERTDLSRSEIVHVFNIDGSRLELSRIPIIYYNENCEPHIVNDLPDFINKDINNL